jgi:hypothetical protein
MRDRQRRFPPAAKCSSSTKGSSARRPSRHAVVTAVSRRDPNPAFQPFPRYGVCPVWRRRGSGRGILAPADVKEYRRGGLALRPIIPVSERRYADPHPSAKATHPEAYGIDCGASRTARRLACSRASSDSRRGERWLCSHGRRPSVVGAGARRGLQRDRDVPLESGEFVEIRYFRRPDSLLLLVQSSSGRLPLAPMRACSTRATFNLQWRERSHSASFETKAARSCAHWIEVRASR